MLFGANSAMTHSADAAFGLRLREAILEDGKRREGKALSQRAIGERVAEMLGRGRVYGPGTVNAWTKGRKPHTDIVGALSVILGCDFRWLALGPTLPVEDAVARAKAGGPDPAGGAGPIPGALRGSGGYLVRGAGGW